MQARVENVFRLSSDMEQQWDTDSNILAVTYTIKNNNTVLEYNVAGDVVMVRMPSGKFEWAEIVSASNHYSKIKVYL